ncbi:MAG TPA: cellulase family glycosylhydrolase [Vicinamibacteria bacterium]|nr:cellulase family glycosylhydrolase [Vicinamibacteria bacterium]
MKRRQFVQDLAVLGVAAGMAPRAALAADDEPTGRRIPRWRGFNLQARFGWPGHPYDGPAFEESDFAAMAEWGFDFARLPLNYWNWGSRDDWSLVREEPLKQFDRAVELGRQYGIHVNINFHRIPGYCINGREMEPMDLFSGRKAERDKALAAAVFHWKTFATRYKGIPSRQLSFDLINEPPWVKPYEGYLFERYDEIVRALAAGIREVDPGRLIIADGLDLGQTPVMEIADLGVAQSTRGYLPKAVSHYTATWVPKEEFETFDVPTWPLKDKKGETWDKERLRTVLIEPWQRLAAKGVAVHVGEWGCFNKTPHDVALAWMGDYLSLWKEAGWGWALWNLRGSFGVMDSERADVAYEDYKGRKLDRRMLELLRRH